MAAPVPAGNAARRHPPFRPEVATAVRTLRFAILALLALALTAPAVAAAGTATAAPAPEHAAAADTLSPPVKVARHFPAIEVRAPLHDLRSSQTVRIVSPAALRSLPVDGPEEVLALQAGVVAQAGELHVRGGRAGETVTMLDGMSLTEPRARLSLQLPLLALRDVQVVTGAPEADYGGALAGVVQMHALAADDRAAGEWRWQTTGANTTRFDRVAARASTPLRALGLGVVAALDATLDNTLLPALRSPGRSTFAGMSFGWRAENRLLGYLQLAPLANPHGISLQVAANRLVHEPYDPQWTLRYPGYNAADHLAITDERQQAVLLTAATPLAARHASAALGWLRTRSVTGTGGARGMPAQLSLPVYGGAGSDDPFHVLAGDDALHGESGSDEFSLRVDAGAVTPTSNLRAGAGATYDDVWLQELDEGPEVGLPLPLPLDMLRSYHAYAPGGYAYVQHRWLSEGLVLNSGLRAEYWTPGPQASRQALPGSARGVLMFSPRLGLTYPVSDRDVFSLTYARLQQPPMRDQLYDRRRATSNRVPLGNPALVPATVITYEAAVKHLFGPEWALQAAVFYRDLYDQVGARDSIAPGTAENVQYFNLDSGQAAGIEWCLSYEARDGARFDVQYTWLQAWGTESRSAGDPYGALRTIHTAPLGDTPLSWDRRHTLVASGAGRWRRRWTWSWSTAVGSALPWTPKPVRADFEDYATVNSRRLGGSECTNVQLGWSPPFARTFTLGLEARNLFDHRGELLATVDGYPNPLVNTAYDDYAAYRTATGLSGGGYWVRPASGAPYWVAVHDPRLLEPPRELRASIAARW
jgi:outer membrane receptor protein involved in Fe transport